MKMNIGEKKDNTFNHFDARGNAHMVDVGGKETTHRVARAHGFIKMNEETYKMMREGGAKKGDVIGVARIAGIMAAKKTSEIIPLCHNILIQGIGIEFKFEDENCKTEVIAEIRTEGRTGAEMEALTAVSISLLTIYDMCKAMDKSMHISDIELISKTGGKSGDYSNEGLHR